MAKLAGKSGTLTLNANVIRITKWEATHEKTFLDTTDTGSSGVQEGIVGVESFNGSFDGVMDGTALMDNMKPNTTGVGLFGVSAAQKYSVAAIIVDTNKITVGVKDAVLMSGTFKSNGAITQLA